MVTIENYFAKMSNVNIAELPDKLRVGHEYVKEVTKDGTRVDRYYKHEDIKSTIDFYLEKLNGYLSRQEIPTTSKEVLRKKVTEHEAVSKKVIVAKRNSTSQGNLVEHFPEEYRFLRQFVNMDGKHKNVKQVLSLIQRLQKARREKKIGDESPWLSQMKEMERILIKTYQNMRSNAMVRFSQDVVTNFRRILGEKVIYPSVKFIKSFIGLQGKRDVKDKAKNLLTAIDRAENKKTLSKSDKYADLIEYVKKTLDAFVKNKAAKKIELKAGELSGLYGAMRASKSEREYSSPNVNADYEKGGVEMINSMDLKEMDFPTIGFTGKWLDFLGDPCPGFYMVLYSLPKLGKSVLCLLFAGYLARNHGKVLYVAREEGIRGTIKRKLNQTNQYHPNITLSSDIPYDLTPYDFIFLDSVNKLGLRPMEIELLRKENPGKSFIAVFQVTKDGKLKGSNENSHDADMIVTISELGKAQQMGRYNARSEMEIPILENL